MNLSEQQQAIIDRLTTNPSSLIIEARAGCGKTTLLREIVNGPAQGQSTFFGAFNKKIVEDIEAKLEEDPRTDWFNTTVNTIHGASFSVLKIKYPNTKVDGRKINKILKSFIAEAEDADEKSFLEKQFPLITQLVSLAKQVGVDIEGNKTSLIDIIENFGLEFSNNILAISVCAHLLMYSAEQAETVVDFDDMIYLPLLLNLPFPQYTWVLLDEAQDTNFVRREFALRSLLPGGNLIAVGDPAQAIYGFTGADSNALDLIREATGADTMPINLTFRCPAAVVRHANQWVSDFSAHPSNPEGEVRHIEYINIQDGYAAERVPFYKKDLPHHTSVILCRNTSPLIDLAFGLILYDIGCKVEGRDIGHGLINLVDSFKCEILADLMTKVQDWSRKGVIQALDRDEPEKAQAISDKAASIIALSNNLRESPSAKNPPTIAGLKTWIINMFKDSKNGDSELLTLSTIHKAKGREWPTVYILGGNKYMPSKFAKTSEQLVQEDNLYYVAVTRAQETLIEISI